MQTLLETLCDVSCIATADKGYYGIRVVNGDTITAGTYHSSVFVSLVGDKGYVEKVSLITSYFQWGIRACTHQDLIIETSKSLGKVLVVILGMEGGWGNSSWFVSYSTVYDLCDDGSEVVYPCYHWIKLHEEVTSTSKSGMCYLEGTINYGY